MRKWWHVPAVLAVLAGTCVGLSLASDRGRARSLAAVDEVLAVVDGVRPGTVVLEVMDRGEERLWSVDDTGEALDDSPDRGQGVPATRHCAGQVCYRVASTALRVEESQDGGQTYRVAWEIGGDDYQLLVESYPEVGDPAQHLSSKSVVVHEVAGSHVVFVANGRDGLLYRNVQGRWLRLGSPASGEGCCYYNPPARLASDPQPVDISNYAIGVVAGAILLAGVITAMVRPRRRWVDALAVLALAALAGYGAKVAANFPDVGMFPGLLYGLGIMAAILVGGVALAVWVIIRGAGA